MVYLIISPLYLLSLLHSLTARLTIRQILDRELSSQGIGLLGSNGSASAGSRKVFVSNYEDKDVRAELPPSKKDWELESQKGATSEHTSALELRASPIW